MWDSSIKLEFLGGYNEHHIVTNSVFIYFFQVNPEITISIQYIDKRWLVKQKCHLCIMHTILIYMSKISFLKINQCLCILAINHDESNGKLNISLYADILILFSSFHL